MYSQTPRSFLKVCVHDSTPGSERTFSYPGFESGKWRCEDFAEYIMEWVPEFALRYGEYANFSGSTGRALMRKAARSIYTSSKKKSRGEFGEILLHALIREHFKSQPAISKVFYKTSSNDTVKGFDAVHIVPIESDEYEIWLGEVKFYKTAKVAIRHVVKELRQHISDGFLRSEFMFIEGKIDKGWPLAVAMEELISDRVSLDEIKTRICLPVLITYDSPKYALNSIETPQFLSDLTNELEQIFLDFKLSTTGINIKIHLFLIPLVCKNTLVDVADTKLKGMQ